METDTFSETPKLQPIKSSYHLRILTDQQLAQLTSATLEIREDIGAHCPSEKALKIYANCGAQVDFESQTVKIPADLPEWILENHHPQLLSESQQRELNHILLVAAHELG